MLRLAKRSAQLDAHEHPQALDLYRTPALATILQTRWTRRGREGFAGN